MTQLSLAGSRLGTQILRFSLQTLYETSTANGFRNANKKEVGKQELVEKIELLSLEKEELVEEVSIIHNLFELNNLLQLLITKTKITLTELKMKEDTARAEKLHEEEMSSLVRANTQLQRQIEGIRSTKEDV